MPVQSQTLRPDPVRLDQLLEVNRQLSRIQPLESLLGAIAAACGRLLDSNSVGIRILDGEDLVLGGVWGGAGQVMSTPRLKVGESLAGIVAASGEPLVVWDPAHDPRLTPAHRDGYRRGGYRAFLGVPLKVGDLVLGLLSILTQHAEGFSAEDVAVATTFAAQAATALENARLYRETEARAEKLRTLSQLTRLMTSAQDSAEVFHAVARAATMLLSAVTTRVWVADPDARVLRTRASFGLDPQVEALMTDFPELPYGKGVVGRIVESRVPAYLQDIEHDPRWLNRRLATEGGLRGFAGIPLIADQAVVGVLAILFRESRPFTADEKDLMALLADQAAIAITNARLVEGLTHQRDRLERLLEVSRQLARIQPVDTLLETIAEACGHVLRSESVGFRVVDGDDLVLAGSWGDAREVMLTPRLKIGESLSGQVAASGESLMVTDIANDARLIPAHREAIARRGYRALLAVPVRLGDRVVGVLSVRTRREGGFSAEDLAMATAFAAQAAVALENSRLLQETQRAYDELAQTQEQLTQSQKLEGIGRLAGGVAHDFNNLLTVIMGRSALLQHDFPPGTPGRRGIDLIQETAERAASLTRQLLAFSRKQVLQPEVISLTRVVANMGELLRRLIGEDIVLATALDPALGAVKADPAQVEQIILNLAVNARDAMPQGGRLTLELANVELDAAYARQHVDARPGPHVMLAMSDTGAGMSPEIQARIFEPFFTTKGSGKGTGLGLATVYGIVRQSGGTIWVYSELGKGTTFKIYLPQVEEPVEPAAERAVQTRCLQGTETILLAEDEDAVRDLAHDALEAHGYTVLEARNGADAQRVSAQHPGPIHVLVTDVVMPGMSGRELADRLTPLRPELQVLYMSGYTDNAVVHHGVLDPGTVFLQKPFTPEALARKVRAVLDSPGGPSR